MEKEKTEEKSGEKCVCGCHAKGQGGAAASGSIYGLAFLGALIYFIQHATNFWLGVLGFFKALVWPAVVVYKLLEFLKL